MLNMFEVIETNNMIEHEKLDVRTITMGISLLDCCGSSLDALNEKIYNKITATARELVSTGEAISRDFGVPIVNKRISVTPIALAGGCACKTPEDFVTIAKTLDKAAKEAGADYLGSGAVFGSNTKPDASYMTYETLSAICRSVDLPVAAIGGIDGGNIEKLKGSGIAGAAVVSGVWGKRDVEKAARELKKKAEALKEKKQEREKI